ncbi:hypothetical protein [Aminobacter phage Erebus]|nr:hypothetical protein [Aminobacter phage Erebus]
MHDIKIEFSVSKSISSTQNNGSIRLFNLSEKTRNALGKELDDLTLEAGYLPPQGGGNVGVIFKGQIRDVEHTRDGADIVTTLSCGEGDKAFRNAVISKTYPTGTKVEDVMEDIYAELQKEGVTRGEWKFPEEMPKFKRPYSVCGSCKREGDTLSRGKDFYWSVQNGTMEIIPGDGYVGTIVLLSPQTGLIDTPTITDNGVKFRALLNPEIRPNRRVKIESQTLEMNAENGEYRVSECTYSGDNRDGDMVVSGTGESLSGGKVDEGKWKKK